MHIQCKMCKIAATIITSVYRSTQYCDKRQEFGNTRQGSTKKNAKLDLLVHVKVK